MFRLRKIYASIIRSFQPEWLGSCYSCGFPWINNSYHTTPYTKGSACFPLCTYCWTRLTPESRVPFYMRLIDRWQECSPDAAFTEERELVRQAVLAGK